MDVSFPLNPHKTLGRTTPLPPRRMAFFSRLLLSALGCIACTGWVNADAGSVAGASVYSASKSVSSGSTHVNRSVHANRSVVAGAVDLNTATAEELAAALKGVGLSKAKAIVRYRTEIGPFRDVQELEEVKGIGPRTLARNKNRITLSRPKR